MIKIADENFNIERYINDLSVADPFGCRIKSLYATYSYNLPFVDFWVEFVNEKYVSLIARLESVFILRLTDDSDIEEISSFLRVSGASSIICDGKYELQVNLKRTDGPILARNSPFQLTRNFDVITPTVKDIYFVIDKCKSDNFSVPSYEDFALDVTHKLNSKTIRMFGISNGIVLQSCIMTLAESEDCAVLGALATLPNFRSCGFGSHLIKYITNKLIAENKSVYLHRAKTENIEFYKKSGFEEYGIWAEYSIED